MSTSPVLVALYLSFDAAKLSPQASIAVEDILQHMISRVGEDAVYVECADLSLTLGAHTEGVIDALIACHPALMRQGVCQAMRGALIAANLSVTASGKTITQRSIEMVRGAAKVVEPGGIFITERLLSIIGFYSPRQAQCFTQGRTLDTSVGKLMEFMPHSDLVHEAAATVVISGFTELMPAPGPLRDQLITRSEKLLGEHIGPLAGLLIKRSNALAQNWNEFVFMVTADLKPELRARIKIELKRIWDERNQQAK